jgi:hypothetical protein
MWRWWNGCGLSVESGERHSSEKIDVNDGMSEDARQNFVGQVSAPCMNAMVLVCGV